MKNLDTYLVNEGLLDNMLFLLDTWFKNNDVEKEEFTNICMQSLKNKTKNTSVKDIKDYLAGTELEKNLKSFVNFIQGDVKMPANSDYYYLFGKIVDNVMANQSKDNKYTTNKTAKSELDNSEIVKTAKEKSLKNSEKQIFNNIKPITDKVAQTNVKNKKGTSNAKTDSTYKVKAKKIVNNVEPIDQAPIRSKAPQNLKQPGSTSSIKDNNLKVKPIKEVVSSFRFRINKDTAPSVVGVPTPSLGNCKENPQLSQNEVDDLTYNLQRLNLPSSITIEDITDNRNGGIKIVFSKPITQPFGKGPTNNTIIITKPERYFGGYKITWYYGTVHPKEMPMGNAASAVYKKGTNDPKFETMEEVVDWINENITRYM